MEAVKPTTNFRYGHYDISLRVASERKLSLTVADSLAQVEYHDPECILENIGVNTLLKALEQSKQEIKVSFCKNRIEENDILEVKVIV